MAFLLAQFRKTEKRSQALALIKASQEDDQDTVRELLDAGADTGMRDTWNGSALMYASCHCNLQIVELLLGNGADLNERSRLGRTPLMWASQKNCLSVVRLLVERGADIELIDQDGKKAMDLAAGSGRREVVDFLERLSVP